MVPIDRPIKLTKKSILDASYSAMDPERIELFKGMLRQQLDEIGASIVKLVKIAGEWLKNKIGKTGTGARNVTRFHLDDVRLQLTIQRNKLAALKTQLGNVKKLNAYSFSRKKTNAANNKWNSDVLADIKELSDLAKTQIDWLNKFIAEWSPEKEEK
jgi:hypothetical protein